MFVDRADDVTKKQPEWVGLPDEDLAYHIAHEVGRATSVSGLP